MPFSSASDTHLFASGKNYLPAQDKHSTQLHRMSWGGEAVELVLLLSVVHVAAAGGSCTVWQSRRLEVKSSRASAYFRFPESYGALHVMS